MKGNMVRLARPTEQPFSLPTRSRFRLWREVRHSLGAYALLAPFFVIFFSFLAFPIGFAFYMSFFDWPGMGQRTFIGLDNYKLLFVDPQFLRSFTNTLLIGVGHVIPTTFLALFLAVILDAR